MEEVTCKLCGQPMERVMGEKENTHKECYNKWAHQAFTQAEEKQMSDEKLIDTFRD